MKKIRAAVYSTLAVSSFALFFCLLSMNKPSLPTKPVKPSLPTNIPKKTDLSIAKIRKQFNQYDSVKNNNLSFEDAWIELRNYDNDNQFNLKWSYNKEFSMIELKKYKEAMEKYKIDLEVYDSFVKQNYEIKERELLEKLKRY